jgi:hypothetical protein
MSFNRLKYDTCETKKYNKETTGPGNYMYQTPIDCNLCWNDNPRVINQKLGDSWNSHTDWRFYAGPVDVESDLLNLDRAASRCPPNKFHPDCTPGNCKHQGEPCGAGVIESCQNNKNDLRNPWNRPNDNNLTNFPNCFFETEDTRLSNPCTNLRGTGINRFDPLLMDPQEQVIFPGNYHTSTRILFKDNHRPSVVAPKINDMNPHEKQEACPRIDGKVCGNFTKPLHQYDVCG